MWSTTTDPLVTARYNHTSTLIPNGKVLVAGGSNNGITYVATADLYEAETCTMLTLLPNGIPLDQNVLQCATATFSAGSSGTPTPTAQWQVSTTSGASFGNVDAMMNPSAATGTLTLTNFTVAMNGYFYRAVFTNTCGIATTSGPTLIGQIALALANSVLQSTR